MKLTLTEAQADYTAARERGHTPPPLATYLRHLPVADRAQFATWFLKQVEEEAEIRRMVRRIAREVPE